MIEKKIPKLISFTLTVLMVVWIFMNTYADIGVIDNRVYIVNNLNDFFSSSGLGYRFGIDDFVAAIRFLEYFVLGILMSVIFKLYYKNILKAWSFLMFVGLFVSVGEVYYKFLSGAIAPVSLIIVSFVSFVLGMALCILIAFFKREKHSNLKYNSRKYRRR